LLFPKALDLSGRPNPEIFQLSAGLKLGTKPNGPLATTGPSLRGLFWISILRVHRRIMAPGVTARQIWTGDLPKSAIQSSLFFRNSAGKNRINLLVKRPKFDY
jgi:hypothetical protein